MDAPLGVERDDARADVAQHHLHVATASLQLGVGAFETVARVAQVARHAVERTHQEADFVVGMRIDLHVEVAARHFGGAFGERADRRRNALGDAESPPDREEHHDQREQQQFELVEALDVPGVGLEAAVLVVRRADLRELLGQREGHEVVHHHRADCLLLLEARPDRHGDADHRATDDFLDARSRVARQRRRHQIAVGTGEVRGRDVGVHRDDQRFTGRAEYLDDAEVIVALPVLHEAGERLALLFAQQPLLGHLIRDAVREERCVVGGRLVVGVGDLPALVERAVDLQAEPGVDRVADDRRRDQEEHDGGHRRDQREGQHELEVQVRAERAAPALENQLHQIARDQVDQQEDQEDVQRVEEQEERRVADRQRAARRRRPLLPDRDDRDRHQHEGRKPQLAAPPAALRGGHTERVGLMRRRRPFPQAGLRLGLRFGRVLDRGRVRGHERSLAGARI